ncbi:hypothetical protein J6590_006994 [Homalodisca vitripennis]|nr:hypothetical protein J6590_006994 [Homalodisca vitripennis]
MTVVERTEVLMMAVTLSGLRRFTAAPPSAGSRPQRLSPCSGRDSTVHRRNSFLRHQIVGRARYNYSDVTSQCTASPQPVRSAVSLYVRAHIT